MSDGDFSEEVALRFKRHLNDDDDDVDYDEDEQLYATLPGSNCLMEFNATEWSVQENSRSAQIPVIRTGDLSVTCSVLCATEAQSASAGSDFEPRLVAESSRLFFLRGVTVVFCTIPVQNDDVNEDDEHFLVRLSQPQVEQLNGQSPLNASAKTGYITLKYIKLNTINEMLQGPRVS